MKTSLWIVVVLVTGIVGFLVGYSVSSFTGAKATAHSPQSPQAPAGYGADAAGSTAQKPPPARPPSQAAAAGY